MRVPIHNILKAGVFIYALFLTFGTYFSVKDSIQKDTQSPGIIQLIVDADNANDAPASAKKQFNSRPVIEDDDDSARDLFQEIIFEREVYVTIYPFHSITYSSFEEDITTPPPKA